MGRSKRMSRQSQQKPPPHYQRPKKVIQAFVSASTTIHNAAGNTPKEEDPLITAANQGVDTSSCPCCGERFRCVVQEDDDTDYFSQTETESSGDEDSAAEMDSMLEMNRMNILLYEHARTQRLLKKNIHYAKILMLQKNMRQKQSTILQRTNQLNSMFTSNIEAILRLSVCAINLRKRTDLLSNGLIEVHKLIEDWDTRIGELAPIPKALLKDDNFVLPSVLDIFKEKFGTNIESMSEEEFDRALKISIDAIPDLLPDNDAFNQTVASLDVQKVRAEWENKENEILSKIHDLEIELVEVSVEYCVRGNLPEIQGYEWAHAFGDSPSESASLIGGQGMIKLKNGYFIPDPEILAVG
ncbi:uncharacterized protein LOC110855910 [Folsomia candida]|uniref:uncharacterized protein LOC110855910 n=1 Tax=Folsomia candida TaxID=158441 RepID=UPI000B90490B|nr:uncharacterized protein LOC110855910 [Folsomia candida]XP_035712521.1 uncharacterized protein LOC110855910 [Folsomia candida]